jgi:hypothetical protein
MVVMILHNFRWKSFIKGSLIIFLLHLVVVGFFCVVIATDYNPNPLMQSEAPEGWMLFFVIDFPLAWLVGGFFHSLGIGMPTSLFSSVQLNYYWDWVLLPGCYFQIVGWINWSIIWGLLLLVRRPVEKPK